ncbi:MAG: transposase [Chloroflexi bacterium]|nr:transposase [Chloroflexota bacterium]
MELEVTERIGAERKERTPEPERTTHRNGYRARPWDTRVGRLELNTSPRQSRVFDWGAQEMRRRAFEEEVETFLQRERYARGGAGGGGRDAAARLRGLRDVLRLPAQALAASLDLERDRVGVCRGVAADGCGQARAPSGERRVPGVQAGRAAGAELASAQRRAHGDDLGAGRPAVRGWHSAARGGG